MFLELYTMHGIACRRRMNHGIDLDLIPESLRQKVVALIVANEGFESEVLFLRERLRLALIKKYGPKSESLSDSQLLLLEIEPGVCGAEIPAEAAQPEVAKALPAPESPGQSKPAPHGRAPLPAHLPRRVVTIATPPERCVCEKCRMAKDLVGYEESEQLHVIPAEHTVLVTRREKRACKRCPEMGVRTEPMPPRILPKGKLSDAFIIEVLIRKYREHVPVYRQCATLLRDFRIEISRQTLVDAVMVAGDLVRALIPPMKAELLAGGYIQADETTVPVQSSAVRGRNHRAFLWQYSRPGGPVIFDFQMGRSREGPRQFLRGFRGWLQSDGYSAYAELGEGIRHAGCMVHARRHFFEANQLAPSAPEPKEVLAIFARIYGIEKEAREQALSSKARQELREAKTRPLMEALKAKVSEIGKASMPSSALGKACNYTLRQWPRLEEFVGDGVLEADNNWCENGMRGIAIGRKNWMHLGDEVAGPKVAAILSLFETCQRLGINAREYLNDVLPRLGDWPANRVSELTPMAWLASRKS